MDDLAFLRMGQARLTLERAAALTGYTTRRIRQWEAAPETAPRWYPLLLRLLAGYLVALPEAGPQWEGWRMVAGSLWSPENEEVREGDLRALPWSRELLREYQRQQRARETRPAAVVLPFRRATSSGSSSP